MSIQPITRSILCIRIGLVNAFLIDAGDLTLIDTGLPGSAPRILAAIGKLGRRPSDLRHILVTHLHADHTGSLKALKEQTDATISMHKADAALVQRGIAMRPARPGPGLLNGLLYRLAGLGFVPTQVEAAEVDQELEDGDILPCAGGIQVVHTPGHSQGHVAFLWPHEGGVLFAGDIAAHIGRLGPSILYEDYAEGKRSLRRVSSLEFAIACFGHGAALLHNAQEHFRRCWRRAPD